MIQTIRNILAKKRQRQLIEIAVNELYSEQFEFESVLKKLGSKGGSSSALRAYISIQVAATLNEPLTDQDVVRANEVVKIWESHSALKTFKGILAAHKSLAQMFWVHRHLAILRGKLAHKDNEYTLAATKYMIERDKKRPASKQEINRYAATCKKMEDLSKQLEEAELAAWKEQDLEEYERYKENIEIRNLQAEIDANEDQLLKRDHDESVSMLYDQLVGLLDTKRYRAAQVVPSNR